MSTDATGRRGDMTLSRVALVAAGVYVGAQVIAQVTSLKIGNFTGRAVDMGTFIYPITFTLRDLIHKAAGRRAMVVSELIDTEVYHWWVTKITTRFQWLRVVVSNSVSIPVDNLIFAIGAFAPLFFLSQHQQHISLPWTAVWDIFWVNLVIKVLVSLGSIPFIYLSPDRHLAEA